MNINELSTPSEHVKKTLDVLSQQQDENYILMLSGGKSPAELYNHMSFSFDYPFPKHVGLTDEIWGNYNQHQHSNELLIKNTGLMGRIRWSKSEFHPVLGSKPANPEKEADSYERKLKELFEFHEKRVVVILSMGLDGSIAGVLPYSEPVNSDKYFISYESGDESKFRLTCTLNCMLEYFSRIILLVNGEEKCGVFNKITQFEEDTEKFPVLMLKNLSNVEAFCYSE